MFDKLTGRDWGAWRGAKVQWRKFFGLQTAIAEVFWIIKLQWKKFSACPNCNSGSFFGHPKCNNGNFSFLSGKGCQIPGGRGEYLKWRNPHPEIPAKCLFLFHPETVQCRQEPCSRHPTERLATSFPFAIIQSKNSTADMNTKMPPPSFVRDIPERNIPGAVLAVLLCSPHRPRLSSWEPAKVVEKQGHV